MNTSIYKIADLSPHLFWDVDKNSLDWKTHPHFLVQRVLEFGLEKDWQILKNKYGVNKIGKIAIELRTLDEIAMHFIGTISNIAIEKFRCYIQRQSLPHFSGY